MSKKKIYITRKDLGRLLTLIRATLEANSTQKPYLVELSNELDHAEIVESEKIPAHVITMNSTAELKDMDSDETYVYTLVYPGFSNPDKGKISVLAPIGTALLGYQEGDMVEWSVPSGLRRLQITKILYQPESVGEFNA